jgi:predicted phage terminase large subunit-like protein
MTAHQNFQFREILMPRGHYKSTISTISDSIRIALPDDVGDQGWPYCLGTDARILIGHELHDTAKRFLSAIQSHFLSNPTLMGLFPECIPTERVQRINTSELELPRTEWWPEPTFDTMGVGGRSQGKHWNFLKLDDLFGDKARDSDAERMATYDWFDNVQSFFSSFAQDKIDLIGTRWAFDDLYAHAHKMYEDDLHKYIRKCEEPDERGNLVSIFPEEFPQEKLKILKRKPKVYLSQYQNDPDSSATEFQQSWLRYYNFVGTTRIATFSGSARPRVLTTGELDKVILIDPAMDGNAGYIITGTDAGNNVYILHAEKNSWKPNELVNKIFEDVAKYQPRLVVIEAVTFSEVYKSWVESEMKVRGLRFRIEPAKTRNRSKDNRIKGLTNYFAAGQIFFSETQHDLLKEYREFGASKDIHILDALAYGPEYWRAAPPKRDYDDYRKAAQEVMTNRDIHTGYSKIRSIR